MVGEVINFLKDSRIRNIIAVNFGQETGKGRRKRERMKRK